MNKRSVLCSTIAVGLLFFCPRAANAACVIGGVRPTVPLPTMADGQEFSFLASADCETLRFRVRGSMLTKHPQPGTGTGSKDRTYKVSLTEREWNSVVDESDTTFTWSIIGTTSAGVTTRVTTTNELKVTIDMSTADATLMGFGSHDDFCGAGDMNGDGHGDLLVGDHADAADSNAGAAYLVLGPVTGTVDSSMAHAKLVGEARNDWAGNSVSGAGDVDGDGRDDLLVGAPVNDEGSASAGAAYLVLGPVTGALDLSFADAKLVGEEHADFAGYSVSGAGDVDADGHDDLLVGAIYNDEGGDRAGATYLVLGPVTGTRDLSVSDAKLVGARQYDYAGYSVAGADDVDGDGNDDLLVGSRYKDAHTPWAGAVYLVLGPVTGTLDLSLADAKLVGEDAGDFAGHSVAGAGDVDGDGHQDLLIGAPYNDGYGAAYLLLGPVTGTFDLSLADAKLVGEAGDLAGYSVSGAGDVDGDGHHDVLVGAPGSSEGGTYAGAAYLVLGPVTGQLDLGVADAKFVGDDDSGAGINVSGAGDVDGDGRDDLLVGAAPGVALFYGGGLF